MDDWKEDLSGLFSQRKEEQAREKEKARLKSLEYLELCLLF
jgi:hypothetical protein